MRRLRIVDNWSGCRISQPITAAGRTPPRLPTQQSTPLGSGVCRSSLTPRTIAHRQPAPFAPRAKAADSRSTSSVPARVCNAAFACRVTRLAPTDAIAQVCPGSLGSDRPTGVCHRSCVSGSTTSPITHALPILTCSTSDPASPASTTGRFVGPALRIHDSILSPPGPQQRKSQKRPKPARRSAASSNFNGQTTIGRVSSEPPFTPCSVPHSCFKVRPADPFASSTPAPK